MKSILIRGIALSLALAFVAVPALGDTYVYVSDGNAAQLNGKDSPSFWWRPEEDVMGAAFDSSGRLWLAEKLNGFSCQLVSPDAPDIVITPNDLVYPGGTRFRNVHLCAPQTGPNESLLVDGDNGTMGSSVVWKLDLGTFGVRRITYGYLPALGPGGRLAVIQHTYEPFRGVNSVTVWESLALGQAARPSSIRRVVPVPRRYSSPGTAWGAPSFSPSGTLAVARDTRVLVGRPGAWTAVGRRGISTNATAWDSDGDLYVASGTAHGSLVRIPGGRPGPTDLWSTEPKPISTIAIGPDTSPTERAVPSVVGQGVDAAEAILSQAGFTLSGTQAAGNPDASPDSGVVVAQSPSAGSLAPLRDLILLTVQP